jgi:hypothetical protein
MEDMGMGMTKPSSLWMRLRMRKKDNLRLCLEIWE